MGARAIGEELELLFLESQSQGLALLGEPRTQQCRYITRPAIANERLALNGPGRWCSP